jgi:nicotinamidase-related amidase
MRKRGTKSRSRLEKYRAGDALLIIDVINDLEFPGGENVLPWALRFVPRLAAVRKRARRAGMPVIYVNDHFGHWLSNFADVYRHCTRRGARGREVGRHLKPGKADYFILKPRHSGFYATSLKPLLEDLGIRRLVLSGIATNLCVLFTAHDAHMHRYPMVVLSDCCAAESDADHNIALNQLERFCDASICLSTDYQFKSPKQKRALNKRNSID